MKQRIQTLLNDDNITGPVLIVLVVLLTWAGLVITSFCI